MMKRILPVFLSLVLVVGCWSIPVPDGKPLPPAPVVTVDSLWLVVVDDITTRTPATAALLTDLGYWQSLSKKGQKWSIVDVNNAQSAQYKTQITEAGGTPCLIILDASTRKELASVKLPSDKSGVDSIIKKWTGK